MKHGAPRRKEISRFGRGLITALWTLGILLALLAGGAAYAGWRVSERERTLPNQWLDGIAVGDLTQEEAASRLREAGWDSLNDLPLTVSFPLSNISFVEWASSIVMTLARSRAFRRS